MSKKTDEQFRALHEKIDSLARNEQAAHVGTHEKMDAHHVEHMNAHNIARMDATAKERDKVVQNETVRKAAATKKQNATNAAGAKREMKKTTSRSRGLKK